MTTMTLQIDDAKAEALRSRAQRVGLEPEQLLRASLDDGAWTTRMSRCRIEWRSSASLRASRC